MVKSVNELVESGNESKKLNSREMDKYRKRLKRARDSMKRRIENKGFKSKEELKSAEKYLEKINSAIQSSYYSKDKKGYRYSREHYEDVTQAVSYKVKHSIRTVANKLEQKADDLFNSYVQQSNEPLDVKSVMKDANVQMRKNLQFERDLAQSRIEGGVSDISNLETTMFYRTTQSIWEGTNLAERNVMIMKHFGVTSLEEAFDIVMQNEEVQKEMEKVRKLSSKTGDTKTDMKGKEIDEEDWKYKHSIISIVSSRIFSR